MSDWTTTLEYRDAKSNKFWRAKTEGCELHINYGRIGSDGQTKVKSFDTEQAATAELDKVAAKKRKKGYADTGAAAAVATPAAQPEPTKQTVKMTITRNDRPVTLTVTADGSQLDTVVTETFADASAAAECYQRIVDGLVVEGYKRG